MRVSPLPLSDFDVNVVSTLDDTYAEENFRAFDVLLRPSSGRMLSYWLCATLENEGIVSWGGLSKPRIAVNTANRFEPTDGVGLYALDDDGKDVRVQRLGWA